MRKILYLILVSSLCCNILQAREYHVSPKGSDNNAGTVEAPFKTINRAARKALPGDVVTVHEGVYREWIKPMYGGTSDNRRIVYQAAEGEKVEIKGSEVIKGWKKEGKGIWKVVIPNTLFGDFNPYKELFDGDWIINDGRVTHLGEVYLNGEAFYEVDSLSKVQHPKPHICKADPEGTTDFWYCETDDKNTTIWARFGTADPNKECVEVVARPTCFYPDKQQLDYITIKGFEMSQAGTKWASPTNEQVGVIATHWCKGWIIENNIIHDAKSTGITLGKERTTGDGVLPADDADGVKDGHISYIEVVFNTTRHGWNKETIGSHIVRNNTIYNCEQTAICGTMAAFSEVYGNHIYNIHVKDQYNGYEIAGIKFHGAIDAVIRDNRIHDCTSFGMWLDWMTQGTRVLSNLMYNNGNDLFIEVSHGPYIVDNNLFLSSHSLMQSTDGGAYLNNLFGGRLTLQADYTRFTPYQLNHSTELKGVSPIKHGDLRFYNNIFVGRGDKELYGLDFLNEVKGPIYAEDNLFCNGARPMKEKEQGVVEDTFNPSFNVEEVGDEVYITFEGETKLSRLKGKPVNTERLGVAKLTTYPFENADGTPFLLDKDFWGKERSTVSPSIGPFEILSGNRIKVW